MKIRRHLAFLLAICMILSVMPVSANAAGNPFVDVFESKYYYQPVMWAVENGITTGKTATEFQPDGECTRAQIVTFLWRANGQPEPQMLINPFWDVSPDAYYYKAVLWAVEKGITTGKSATEFQPNGGCTRAQVVTFLWRASGKPEPNMMVNPFADLNGGTYYYSAVLWAVENGITTGKTATTFQPSATCTRGQIVTFLYRAQTATSNPTPDVPLQPNQPSEPTEPTQPNEPTQPTQPSKELNAEQVYAKCSPAVFYIEVYDVSGKAFATGSGFFIDSNGTAVTNYHVIEGACSAKITTSDTGTVYDVLGVYDYSAEEDWAVIQVGGSGFAYLNKGASETVTGGATVYAIGSPLGLDNTISQGLISNPARVVSGVTYIQISAAISHGSSGGALINKYGDVIGITSAGFTDGQNLNLALPITVIDGYNHGDLITLQELAGYGGSSGGNDGTAYAALQDWIVDNYNKVLSGSYVFEHTVYSDGAIVTYRFYYEPGSDYIIVSTTYYEDGDEITAYMDYSAIPEESVTTYFYDSGSYYSSNDFSASGLIDRAAFNEDYIIYYYEYEGASYNLTTHKNIHNLLLCMALQFTNVVFDSYMPGYTVADLGFTSFE